MTYFAHATAVIDETAVIGDGSRIWHFTHVSDGAVLGVRCNIGQNVFVGRSVRLGTNVKVQNNVSLYEGVELEDNVFCGPSCVFTNIVNPRSEIVRKGNYARTLVRRGASIGANATIVCGTVIGRYALIAAGAVVARGVVPDYALMVGVPARQRGWVSRHGHILPEPDAEGTRRCPESGWRYVERDGVLTCRDKHEDEPID